MKYSDQNKSLIEDLFRKFSDYCKIDYNELGWEEDVSEGDETIVVNCPGDDDGFEMPLDYLQEAFDGRNEIIEVGSTIRCGIISQTLVDIIQSSSSWNSDIFETKYETDLFELSLVETPFLIGVRNLRHGCYDHDFWSSISGYYAAEFKYKDETSVLSIVDEIKELNRFLFFIAVKYGLIVTISSLPSAEVETLEDEPKFNNADEYLEYLRSQEEIVPEKVLLKTDQLPPYSPMLGFYIDALALADPKLQYLLFYKILEYVSPSIAKKNAYDALSKKLDLQVFERRDYQYYDSILEIAKHYNNSKSDKELASTVLLECCDIISLGVYLPESIKGMISNDCGIKANRVWNHSDLSDVEVGKLNKKLGEYLYDTRNSIVHAKSNYQATGKECSENDIPQLNEFMKRLCYAIIMWNNRQPDEMMLK